MDKVRVRFAPSPTGPLHIGGARTALFNWLFAKRTGGTFVLRSEDTDRERSSRESEAAIMRDLAWLGITWDEGVDVGGPRGPYRQTERLDIYTRFTNRLLEDGLAYQCFCSEEELAQQRREMLAHGETPRYQGRCRSLTAEDRERLLAEGRKPVVRFRVPGGKKLVVDDLVHGEVEFASEEIGDFIIVKSDGIPTYNFAAVIDDHLMGISHVIRGEEHLSNTPRQLLLYQALGWKEPQFAHIPLILDEDRTKMSKRKGDVAVEEYRRRGYLPEAIVNFLALLGWSPEGEEEIFSLQELTQRFSLERVSKSPAVFNTEKLKWLNAHYIKASPDERILELALPHLKAAGYVAGEPGPEERAWLLKVVGAVKEYLTEVSEITDHIDFFFSKEVKPEDSKTRQILREEQVPSVFAAAGEHLDALPELTPEAVRADLRRLTKELGLTGRRVYMPLRIALTGRAHGPELYQVIAILGRERVKERLAAALAGRS
ncbi:MAG TPA: glutamate--tRNA ligase [Firmicutes bacterium]|uniref:glutamate--tRNA ligase n=1 Tax=Gelria sp. Kuro-4 TaxID=2796927 RepID=UPI0019C27139|nr:glutamate--tRNA ligase [Gelria sp. Kuro-4]MDI3522777.1 nondiscriminating glutamyl-tRNA synthetase [Bacillota bacterium]MDK2928254.1 nondiscriminating glutamyl-tRNA synthetase [Bacillota bacterium]BCV23344.1 glutamate--tRNA ligase [Gelria sp. Kuro-4]HHV56546.1 glutamate--tRNA ligase [Bacillota bacterium]